MTHSIYKRGCISTFFGNILITFTLSNIALAITTVIIYNDSQKCFKKDKNFNNFAIDLFILFKNLTFALFLCGYWIYFYKYWEVSWTFKGDASE